MLDWKEKAITYDKFIFDWNNQSPAGPLIWLGDTGRHGQTTFGLYTAIRYSPGQSERGEFHEKLNLLAAILEPDWSVLIKRIRTDYEYVKMWFRII